MLHVLDEVGQIGDAELVCRLERLVMADRASTAKLLLHLGEVHARELYCERAYSSMFDYCRSGLGMSEGEAGLRILCARIGRQFPLVLERLANGAVHLTAIKLLAPVLTPENHVQLLDRVRGMTKRQIEVMVADLAPKPDAPARIRRLPKPHGLFNASARAANPAACSTAPKSAESNTTAAAADAKITAAAADANITAAAADANITAAAADANITAAAGEPSATAVSAASRVTSVAAPVCTPPMAAGALSETAVPPASQAAPGTPSSMFALQSPRARATSTPLGLGRFKLQVTLGQEAQEALDQLVELFRHQNPSGDLTSIVERALIELRKTKMKQRFGQTNAPKSRSQSEPAAVELDIEPKTKNDVTPPKSRHIPAEVRRRLHARDNGQCTFVSPDGRRCTERGFIEVHHHNTTFARGGEATADNLRLTCRAHNRFFAEHDYGRGFMQQKLSEAKARSTRRFTIPGTDHP